MRFVYETERGVIRFDYKMKTLFMANLSNGNRINLNFINQNALDINKLVLYNVDKTIYDELIYFDN